VTGSDRLTVFDCEAGAIPIHRPAVTSRTCG
jgi:hypothetical protein